MDELELMKTNPKALFDYYMSLLQSGEALSTEQLIKLEYITKHGNL